MQERADASSGMVFLTGNSHPELARMVSECLEICLGEATVYNKTNRETSVDIKQSVRGKYVLILQSGSKNVNNDIMELLVLIYACKASMSKTITVIMPYLPYSKQCRMLRHRHESCCRDDLQSRCKSLDVTGCVQEGDTRILLMPSQQSSCVSILPSTHQDQHYKNAIIVAKSPGVLNKAASYAGRLCLGVAVIHGEQKDEEESGFEDGRQSPPPNVTSYDLLPANESKQRPTLTVVENIGGRIAIMVDDIIDDAQSFVAAAEVLKALGACNIYLIATHRVLSWDAPALAEALPITEVIVTNTVPRDVQKIRCHKIKTVDVSLMICKAIRRIFHNESMGQLFRDVTIDD